MLQSEGSERGVYYQTSDPRVGGAIQDSGLQHAQFPKFHLPNVGVLEPKCFFGG